MSGDPHSSASAARHSHVPSHVALLRVCADGIRAVLPPQVPPAEVITRSKCYPNLRKMPVLVPNQKTRGGGGLGWRETLRRELLRTQAARDQCRRLPRRGGIAREPAPDTSSAGYRLGAPLARGQLGGRPGVAGLAQFSRACFGTSCLARHLLVVARCRQSSSGARNRASNSGVGARHSSAWPNHS